MEPIYIHDDAKLREYFDIAETYRYTMKANGITTSAKISEATAWYNYYTRLLDLTNNAIATYNKYDASLELYPGKTIADEIRELKESIPDIVYHLKLSSDLLYELIRDNPLIF